MIKSKATDFLPHAIHLRLEPLEVRELLDAASILPATPSYVDLAPACVATLDETDSPIDLSNAVTGANWLVTSTADDGASGTLRYALEHANDGDTVTFADSLKGKTITLNGSQLEIEKAITIDASGIYDSDAGKPGITIDADGKSRVFDMTSNVEVNGFEIINGRTGDCGGGIIINGSNCRITNCVIANNKAIYQGGGICFRGSATFTNCAIINNESSSQAGGGVYGYGIDTSYFYNCTIAKNLWVPLKTTSY